MAHFSRIVYRSDGGPEIVLAAGTPLKQISFKYYTADPTNLGHLGILWKNLNADLQF
jgi:hypothetical protein